MAVRKSPDLMPAREAGVVLLDALERRVRKDGDLHGREGADVVIQPRQGVGVEVHEIAWQMHRHQVALAVGRVDVPRHEPLEQQGADMHGHTLGHDDLSGIVGPGLGDGGFQDLPLGHRQLGGAVSQDVGQEHGGTSASQACEAPESAASRAQRKSPAARGAPGKRP